MINQYMWIKLKYPINKEIFLRPIQSTLCNKETFFTYYTAEEELSTNAIPAWKDFPFTRLKKWMVISSKLNKSQCLMKLILFLFQGRVDHFHFILISRLELSCWQPGNARSCLKYRHFFFFFDWPTIDEDDFTIITHNCWMITTTEKWHRLMININIHICLY